MTTAFGLDLAGYAAGRSALAKATADDDGSLTVAILTGHVFRQRINGENPLPDHANEETNCLLRLMEDGPVYIDVPIDLQDLPIVEDPQYVWQLTKRPVDQTFGGLPPLADRLGACVARMQNLWRLLRANGQGDPLGHQVFETYPAASLKHAKEIHEKYKGRIQYSEQKQWQAWREGNDKDSTMARLLNHLQWTGGADGFSLTHDEFDAALCALTGVCEQLSGRDLNNTIKETLGRGDYETPDGYVLLKTIPPCTITSRDWRCTSS